MRALFALALLPLMACEDETNVMLSSVALIHEPEPPLSVSYECNEGPALSVIYYQDGGTATVSMLGIGQQVLYIQPAASGFHYRNDEFELRGKGNDVNWNHFGVTTTDCVAVGDPYDPKA
ncbi:MliC family protein [Rhodobacteraceae bacterium NNCM2]|nr:MliC family protein [Coraliihabitans acroporae]